MRIYRIDGAIVADLGLAMLAIVALAACRNKNNASGSRVHSVAHLVASFSFTLYVVHVPLIFILQAIVFRNVQLDPGANFSGIPFLGAFVAIILTAWVLGVTTEGRTPMIRTAVRRSFEQRTKVE